MLPGRQGSAQANGSRAARFGARLPGIIERFDIFDWHDGISPNREGVSGIHVRCLFAACQRHRSGGHGAGRIFGAQGKAIHG